jgi:hypothetical protein
MKPPDIRSLKVSRPILYLLIATAALIAYAYFQGGAEDDTPEAPVVTPARRASAPSAASASDTGAATDVANAEPTAVDLFPSQNWAPPPPPPPPAPPPGSVKPPPPPEPPPLPFTVRSLWLDQQGVFYVVLAGAAREFPLCENCQKKGFLRSGDVILNAYRIEHIDRREVGFTYLPLKRRQTLTLGELK